MSEWGLALESVVTDANEIRRRYTSIYDWFLIDLVSSVPWDVLIRLFTSRESKASALKLTKPIKLMKMTKMLKLLRLTRLTKMFKKWEDYLDFQYNFTVNDNFFNIFALFGVILYVIHFNACLIFFFPAILDFPTGDPGPTWVTLRKLEHAEPFEQYSWARKYATGPPLGNNQ